MGLDLPPFLNYPPYFTLQPIEETKRKQSALWQQLILSYCKEHKIYKIQTSTGGLPIFENKSINRRLNIEAQKVFLGDLVASGHGLWLDKNQDQCLILWKKLEVWAQIIHSWARASGLDDSVMTIDELSESAETAGTELEGTPRELLISAIRLLETKGKAKLFKGSSSDDAGVKFFA